MNNFQKNSSDNSISFKDLIIKYSKKWYWFLLAFVVFGSLSVLYIKSTNKKYKVQATILLRQDDSNSMTASAEMLSGFGLPGMSSKQIDDEIQVMSSMTIMKNIISSLNVSTIYYEKQDMKYVDTYPSIPFEVQDNNNAISNIKKKLKLKIIAQNEGYLVKSEYDDETEKIKIKDITDSFQTQIGKISLKKLSAFKENTTYKIEIYPLRNLAENYSNQFVVTDVSKKSNAINISTISDNVNKAKDMINKLIELYNLDAVVDKNLFASNTATFINERIDIIKEELTEMEIKIEDYKVRYNLTDIKTEALMNLEISKEYEKYINSIENQISMVEMIEDVLNKPSKNELIPANLGIKEESLVQMVLSYNELVLNKIKLEKTSKSDNPVFVQLNSQIEASHFAILQSVSSIKDGLKVSRDAQKNNDKEYINKIKNAPKYEREFVELKRQQSIKQELFLFLMQKREENSLTLASTIPSAKTLDAAYSSIEPSSPNIMLLGVLLIVLSLGFPLFILYLFDMFNNTIADKRELLKLVNAPFLGSIVNVKDHEKIVVKEGSTAPVVELFRLIRTNLQFMMSGKKSPVILVTSSVGGEGKSFVSINLAMSFALMNKKVVLVGLDVRKPMLGEYMHISKNTGVSIFLADPYTQLKDIVVPSGFHPSLSVVPAGPIPPNPSELLLGQRLDELFAGLKEEYDYIVVDSAPIGKVSDTYLLNRIIDNTVYVTRQSYTPRDVSELINDIYENQKLNGLGIVLNGVGLGASSGYGYSYGYSKDEKSKKFFK